jgi:hypothetical protein
VRLCCICSQPLLCRFSDAGNHDLTHGAAAGVRKAPRHEIAGSYARWAVPQAQLWGFERRACRVDCSGRGEPERLRDVKRAGAFVLTAWERRKRRLGGELCRAKKFV